MALLEYLCPCSLLDVGAQLARFRIVSHFHGISQRSTTIHDEHGPSKVLLLTCIYFDTISQPDRACKQLDLLTICIGRQAPIPLFMHMLPESQAGAKPAFMIDELTEEQGGEMKGKDEQSICGHCRLGFNIFTCWIQFGMWILTELLYVCI